MRSKSTGGYIDGLKYFGSTDLEGIPFFPREPVISRLLTGSWSSGLEFRSSVEFRSSMEFRRLNNLVLPE